MQSLIEFPLSVKGTRGLARAGIYQIICRINGKRYIGSASNLIKRCSKHRSDLRLGKHENGRLMNAYRKYGEDVFRFGVLEFVDGDNLLEREQAWLDSEHTHDDTIGFNIGAIAGGPKGCKRSAGFKARLSKERSHVWMGFISPSGEMVTITNLFAFCKKHGLTPSHMRALADGTALSCKGWRHVSGRAARKKFMKTYEGFIDPRGNAVGPVTGIHQFCLANGLDVSAMMLLANGGYRQYKGWTYQFVRLSDLEAI
jgi:hypothetical protein